MTESGFAQFHYYGWQWPPWGLEITDPELEAVINDPDNWKFGAMPGGPGGSGRAVEYLGGRITQSGFVNAALRFLGRGYREVSPGRFLSIDRLRQVRFGTHEIRGRQLHGHFEALFGGRVIENTRVIILPD